MSVCFVSYWGKKSVKFFRYVIADAWRELHGVVLDPYGGSGGLVKLMLSLGKRAIYNDVNPIAVLVARYNIARSKGDIENAVVCFRRILEALGGCSDYVVRCPTCGVTTEVLHAIHDNGTMREYLACGHVIHGMNSAHSIDTTRAEAPQWALEGLRGLKVSVGSIADLFTPRNLRAVGVIREVLAQCPDVAKYYAIPLIYLLSKMAFIPLNKEQMLTKRNWKPSWAVPAVWVPRRFVEFNPCRLIASRVEAIARCRPRNYVVGSVKDVLERRARVAFINEDAKSLPLPDESVDIVTDPPYPTDIQYGELYQVFARVLGIPYDEVLERELIVNEARGRSLQDYLSMFKTHMNELYRVTRKSAIFILKDSKYTNKIMDIVTQYFNIISEKRVEVKIKSRIGDHKSQYKYRVLILNKKI